MDLSAAASFFDDVQFTEVGTSLTWMGQFDLYDDSKRDGLAPVRRIISVDPDAAPNLTGKIFSTVGQTYITGLRNEDLFDNEIIRVKYVVQQCENYLAGSLLQFLQGAEPTINLGRVWTKDESDDKESSELHSQYQFISSKTENRSIELIFDGVNYYFVFGRRLNTSDLVGLFAEEVGTDVLQNVQLFKRQYQPLSDTYNSTPLGTKVSIKVRYKLSYYHKTAAFKAWEEGDKIYFLEQSSVPTLDVDDKLQDGTTTYRIIGKHVEGGVIAVHVRK